MVKQVSSCSGISSGFRVFFIFSAILALTSSALAGSGQLTSNPSDLNFGSVQIGSSQTRSLTLTNSGNSRLIITQATPSVSGFTISGLVYPVTLNAGKSINGSVAFTPQSVGTSNGSVLFAFHDRRYAGGTFTMTLPTSGSGFSSGPLTSTPTSLSFGNLCIGRYRLRIHRQRLDLASHADCRSKRQLQRHVLANLKWKRHRQPGHQLERQQLRA
jgi:Abnormal spindle-like microcephaly-assoc'd, ASPM-SPD-2-Hydin